MEIVGYHAMFSNSVGDCFFRKFSSFNELVDFSKTFVTSGYFMFVVPIFR